jgi:hypothetical protein
MSVPKSAFPEFVVLSFERPEGERFAIFRGTDWLLAASPSQWRPPTTMTEALERFVQSLDIMTEDSTRERLQKMGLSGDAIADHIVRARRMREMSKGGSWEVVTAPGYRNEEGQVVVGRTSRTGGEPAQRVFLMQCSVCGHDYGTYGAEIPHRLCPNCQDRPSGFPP